MRSVIAWICDHALAVVVGWFGLVAAGYTIVAVIWICDRLTLDCLFELAKSALPISGLGLALVGVAATLDKLSPQARLNLHWLSPPNASGTAVPILELENCSSTEARGVELAALIRVRRQWLLRLAKLSGWRYVSRHRRQPDRAQQDFNSELFNHIQFWNPVEEDPVWERSKRNVLYPVREVWLLSQPLAPGQKLLFGPRFEKGLRHQIVKADESIEGITFIVNTSTGRKCVFKDTRLVPVIRSWGLS